MKLYLVKLRGMQTSVTGVAHGCAYVVAEDPTQAYNIVKEYVNSHELGFPDEREMESVELLAETGDYPNCRTQIFIAGR